MLLLSSLFSSHTQAQDHESSLPTLQGRRAVIVEDEGITQMQIQRLLTRAGVLVVGTAGNGADGVDRVLQQEPDLVLMDIKMPLMDGMEATRRILARFRTCIVLLTAYLEYEEQARQLGACGYLVKPISSLTLLPQLQQALHNFYQQ